MNDTIQNKTDGGETAGKKAKLKKILYPLLFAVVIIGCCTGYYMFSVNMNYFSTDNAKVTAKLYTVMPVTSGKLISWDVENGDLVEQDQVLGRQEVLPYITSPITGTVVKNDGAVNQTIPLILCAEEDVQGSHGATIGRLDDELLFYLCSRGMSREKAAQVMTRAKLDKVCRKIGDEAARRLAWDYLEEVSGDGN